MKNIQPHWALTFLALTISLLSCQDDFLNTKVDTLRTQEMINSSYYNFFNFAATPYTFLYSDFNSITSSGAITDEAEPTSASVSSKEFTEGRWNAFNNPDDKYATYYNAIRSANYFLEIADNYRAILGKNRDTVSTDGIKSYNEDLDNALWFRAEAHISRAYYYFELLKRYGGVPLVTKTLTVSENANIARSSYDEIVKFIIDEIDNNLGQLQTNWKTSSFKNYDGRFSKGSAMALKSRVLLYAASPLHNSIGDVNYDQKWMDAALAALDVINYKQYSLDVTNYANYFLLNNTLTSTETILCVRNWESNYLERANYPIATPGGNSGVCPTQNLVSDFEIKDKTIAVDPKNPYKNRDPRLAIFVVTQGSTWNSRVIDNSAGGVDDMANSNTTKTGYYLKKLMNDKLDLIKNQGVVHNWVIFRYAEILLNYAEALNEVFGPDNDSGLGLTPRQALNMVRSRVGVAMPNVTTTDKALFRSAVKHERRIELAFEGHRYWDLLRWKDAEMILNQPIQGVSISKNTDGTFSFQVRNVGTRTFDASKMYYYPISQSEINKSKGVLLQNPNW